MLTNSRDIIRRLQSEGWRLVRVKGSHHHFFREGARSIVTVPHPKRDISIKTALCIYKQAGSTKD